jgi:integrase
MWDQVDLDAGVIALGRTKDKKSKVIYLCQQAIDLLRAHRKRKLDEGALSKPVFECFNPGRTWVTLVRPKVGLDKSLTQEAFTLHGFRHNFLTYAAEAGLPESIRKRLVGHAKSRDVTEGYTLVSPAHMKRQVQRVGDALENLNFETSYLQA